MQDNDGDQTCHGKDCIDMLDEEVPGYRDLWILEVLSGKRDCIRNWC